MQQQREAEASSAASDHPLQCGKQLLAGDSQTEQVAAKRHAAAKEGRSLKHSQRQSAAARPNRRIPGKAAATHTEKVRRSSSVPVLNLKRPESSAGPDQRASTRREERGGSAQRSNKQSLYYLAGDAFRVC